MSRRGKLPVTIPDKVEVQLEGDVVRVKGPLGELQHRVPAACRVQCTDGQLMVSRKRDDRESRALHGTTRSLIANMVKGVSEGFERSLEIVGMGYRAALEKQTLVLNLGFSHQVRYAVSEGIAVEVPKPTLIRLRGCDKQAVGQVAAEIRALRKPEPYKGKGIRYQGEHIRRKVGKAALGSK